MPRRLLKAAGVDPVVVQRLRDLAEQEGTTLSSLLERMAAEHVGLEEHVRYRPRPTALPDHVTARMSVEIYDRLAREAESRGVALSAHFRDLITTHVAAGGSAHMHSPTVTQDRLELEEHYLRSA